MVIECLSINFTFDVKNTVSVTISKRVIIFTENIFLYSVNHTKLKNIQNTEFLDIKGSSKNGNHRAT